MKKTLLNVHFSANMIDENVLKFLKQDFEINIIEIFKKDIQNLNDKVLEKIKSINLIVFTGGEDVDPSYYNENIGKYTRINKKRDELEFLLLRGLPSNIIKNIPKLGICRG